jgi:hypothetical protein
MGQVTTLAAIEPWFLLQMRRLIGLKFAPPEMTTHWEALKNMPEPLLAEAVTRAQRECTNFPAPWMLRSFGEQARARVLNLPPDEDRTKLLPEPVTLGRLPNGMPVVATRTWSYYCDACSDSGWRSLWCGATGAQPWHTKESCLRLQEHGTHEWVKPCPCADGNPAIIRRKEKQLQAVRNQERERE